MTDCAVCGGVPAAVIPVRRHVGMLIMQRFYKVNEPLCRDCGLSLTKEWTARTLVQGWWGLISVFVNCFVLIANGIAATRFSQMDDPTHEHLPTPEEALRQLDALYASGDIDESDYDTLKTDLLNRL